MDALMQIELQITLFLQHLGTWLVLPFKSITFLGEEFFYLLIMPALYWCVDAELGARLGAMLVLSNSINGYFKMLFRSPRPFWVDPKVKAYVNETSFGLPSGHSQNAASMWGTAAATIKKKWATILCTVVVFLIGLSRIYLGAHFTRDVLGGWLLGGLCILLYFWLEKPILNWLKNKSLYFQIILSFIFSLVLIGIGCLVYAFTSNFQIPAEWTNNALAAGIEAPDPFNLDGFFTIAGVWFGFTGGFAWLVHKKGKILIQGSLNKRILRFALGLVGVAVIYLGLKLIFPVSPTWLGFTFRYIRYALLGLWVSALAPVLFEKVHLDQ
jgi:membrane-associated phospholipid phosphatase